MPAVSRMRSFLVMPFVMLALVAGLFTAQVSQAPEAEALAGHWRIKQGVKVALNQIGDPYRYGAAGPHAFDCSGLIYHSYRKVGMGNVPRTSDAQVRWGRRIKRRHMKRGDLMAFYDSGGVHHVAIFLGWNSGRRLMLHSPYGGKKVARARPWTNRWFPVTFRRRR